VSPAGSPAATSAQLGHFYDWLSRYVQLANWLAYGDRFAGFTMHKALAGGVQEVNDRLLEEAHLPPHPRVLDAGCGFGGTIFAWQPRTGGTYDGLTLSGVQLRVARREARRLGIDATFYGRSFDEPLEGRYDAIVAIETLIHSPDLGRTLANLAAGLAPEGKLLIVDDLATGDVPPHDAALLANHWGCPYLWSEDDYTRAFAAAGLTVITAADLTDRVRPRDVTTLAAVEQRYTRLHRRLPLAPVRAVLNAYLGGIALERLYATRALRYRLFVAKPT